MEVRQLRAFVAVVEHGSLRAAGQALGLAQSTISESLTALDHALGTPMLHRKRGAHASPLTAAGEVLLPYARRLLLEIDGMHQAIAQVTRDAKAHVHIVANESVSTYVLASALGALRGQWPKLQVSVTVGTCANVRRAVANGQCDLGLLLEEQSHSIARAIPEQSGVTIIDAVTLVADVPLVIFGADSHRLIRAGAPVRRDALQPFSLLIADSAGDFHELIRRYSSGDGLPGPQLVSVGSVEAVKRGVETDANALGLLPGYAVVEEIARGNVRALAIHPSLPPMQLIALRSQSGGSRHPMIDELLDTLRRSWAGTGQVSGGAR